MTSIADTQAPESLYRRIALRGATGYPQQTVRRLATINIVAAICVALSLAYIPPYALYDLHGLWIPIVLIVLQGLAFAFVPYWHRFGDTAAANYFMAVWLVFITIHAINLGRDSGIHFFFLPGAAGALLFYGPRRIGQAALFSIIPLALFMFAEFTQTAPASYVRTDPTLLLLIRLSCIATSYCLIFFMVFYAFSQTRKAEEALEKEHARSERLLGNLLPESIALRLKNEPDKIIADDLGQVTILFADIVDFTPRAAVMQAPELVAFLNRVFTEFDKLAEKHRLEKIKTIGDAYMVAAGLPLPRDDHIAAIAEMALDMLDVTRRLSAETGENVAVRVGLHTGPAVAGVIGTRKFFYDVWGDTVNTAARMESQGEPGRIQVTPEARAALADAYEFAPRGEIDVKGKGRMTTWWLIGRKATKADAA